MKSLVFLACTLCFAAAPLTPVHLYNGLSRPVMIDVAAPADASVPFITLALMDVDGRLVDDPVSVQPGRIDMAQALPLIWEIRKSCYVQAMSGREPVGPALVIQPLLTRLPPQTTRSIRPDGITPYTKIIGWGTPKTPPPPPPPPSPTTPVPTPENSTTTDSEPTQEPAPTEPTTEPAAPVEPAPEPAPPPVTEIEPQYFSGLRIYVERDVVMDTDQGRMVFAMRPDEAPNTVWNFLELVKGGFYDGIIFHRIVPYRREGTRFVIQAGDHTRTGNGDAGSWLPIEPSEIPHDFGVISMARDDDPDSAGSQFFVALSREGTRHLDGQYCAFGHAVEGADVINAIAGAELADVDAGRPRNPPTITHAELRPSPPRQIGQGRPDRRVVDTLKPDPLPGRVPR